MKRYVRTKNIYTHPQAANILYSSVSYAPVFLHATINQTRPVGNKTTFKKHKHDFYHIVLYTEGRGEYLIEGNFYPAQSGTCVLISPGQSHDFVSHWKESVYSELTFAYESRENEPLCIPFNKLLSLYAGTDVQLDGPPHLSLDRISELHNLLGVVTNSLAGINDLSDYNACHNLGLIFDFLIKLDLSGKEKKSQMSGFERAKSYIDENYTKQINVEKLAGLALVSKGYFFREFKKRFGYSPVAYQQATRIEAAKTLLKATSLRCNEIAWQVGFGDVHFFHRTFKKNTGLTPLQYRDGHK